MLRFYIIYMAAACKYRIGELYKNVNGEVRRFERDHIRCRSSQNT